MKKYIIAVLVLCILFSGCQIKEKEQEEEKEVPKIYTEKEVEGDKEEEKEEDKEQEKEVEEEGEREERKLSDYYAFTMRNNISDDANLNTFTINKKSLKFPLNSEDFFLERCDYSSSHLDTKLHFFVGSGYGIKADENDSTSFGGITFLQGNEEGYFTAIHVSDFFTEDDVLVTVSGLRIGDKREVAEEKYGKGKVIEETFGDRVCVYKNKTGTLVVEYENDLISELTLYNEYII